MSDRIPSEKMLEAAQGAIPGYTTAALVVARSERWLRQKQATFIPSVGAESELQTAAESGDEFPAGLGQRINDAAAAVAARNTELTHLKNFVNGARERLTATIKDGVDDGLNFLSEQMADVVDQFRAEGDAFRDLPSFEEIAATNDQTSFRVRGQWQELTKRYVAIRSAQQALVREALRGEHGDNGHRVFLQAGQIADLIDHEGYFIERRSTTHWDHQTRHFGHALLPWREATTTPLISAVEWRVAVPVEPEWQMRFVLRICTEAEPWVPGLQVMLAAVRLAELATGTPTKQGEAPLIDALLELQELTGWESPGTPEPMKPRPVKTQPKLSNEARYMRGMQRTRERLNR